MPALPPPAVCRPRVTSHILLAVSGGPEEMLMGKLGWFVAGVLVLVVFPVVGVIVLGLLLAAVMAGGA